MSHEVGNTHYYQEHGKFMLQTDYNRKNITGKMSTKLHISTAANNQTHDDRYWGHFAIIQMKIISDVLSLVFIYHIFLLII